MTCSLVVLRSMLLHESTVAINIFIVLPKSDDSTTNHASGVSSPSTTCYCRFPFFPAPSRFRLAPVQTTMQGPCARGRAPFPLRRVEGIKDVRVQGWDPKTCIQLCQQRVVQRFLEPKRLQESEPHGCCHQDWWCRLTLTGSD